jgi:NAD(P)H-hydrate repair Nnr-like enzyme with NAD(P)H-hydrate epimerase domain
MEGIISGASSTKFLDTLGSDSNASPQTKHVVVVVGGGGGGGGAMVVMVAYLE